MKKKTVSNLLIDIGKVRDLLEEGDTEKIYRNCVVIARVQEEVRKYVKRFFHNHQKYEELDFTVGDLEELSNEAFDFIKNYPQKFTVKALEKDLSKVEDLTIEIYNSYTIKWEKLMKIDTYLRALYKTLSYVTLALKKWSREKENKTFEQELVEAIQSCL